MLRNVSVVGLGKLGACMAATMASKGSSVLGVDVNQGFVDKLNQGEAPVVEPGLSDLVKKNKERLKATTDIQKAVLDTDATFIIVPTPSNPAGDYSLKFVLEVFKELGKGLAKKSAYHLVVLSSTVLPGSVEHALIPELEKLSGKKCGTDFGFCYNPEFIALGNVVSGLLKPDFVLIGQSDEKAGKMLEEWYKTYCDNNPPVARMNLVNAELTKISVNTFITTKISFANMLLDICEKLPGADVDVVTQAVGIDTRIGRRYLKGGLGYGGPCFPRDNRALAYIAHKIGANPELAEATDRVNHSQIRRSVDRITKDNATNTRVAILGLAYKPDTPVIEESHGIATALALVEKKVGVVVYDPLAMEPSRKVLQDKVTYASSVADALSQATHVIVFTPTDEFKNLKSADFPKKTPKVTVYDCWRLLRPELESCAWVTYIPFGIGFKEKDREKLLHDLWTSQSH